MQFWKNWLRSPFDVLAQCKPIQNTRKPKTTLVFAYILCVMESEFTYSVHFKGIQLNVPEPEIGM